MAPPPELSYLALVERNNELLARLVDLLSEVEIPPAMRPVPNSTYQIQLHTRVSHYPLLLTVEARPEGLTLLLRDVTGVHMGRLVWAWVDPPDAPFDEGL